MKTNKLALTFLNTFNKKKSFFLIIVFLLTTFIAYSQSPIGIWSTFDDELVNVESHVQIYEKKGKLYGKIVKLFINPEHKICIKCTGKMKDQPLIGLEILKDMEKVGSEWTNGKITDPKNGKTYSCTITLKNKDKLKLRGYIGFPFLGENRYWTRMK